MFYEIIAIAFAFEIFFSIYKIYISKKQNNSIDAPDENKPYDLFISYSKSMVENVEQLNEFLLEKKFKTWFHKKDSVPSNRDVDERQDAIMKSKIFVCCIFKEFAKATINKDEVHWAYDNKKRIVALLFDDVSIKDLEDVGFIIAPLVKVELFHKKNNIVKKLSQSQIHKKVEHALRRVLNKIGPEENQVPLEKEKLKTVKIESLKKLNLGNPNISIKHMLYISDDYFITNQSDNNLRIYDLNGNRKKTLNFKASLVFYLKNEKILIASSPNNNIMAIWKLAIEN